MRILLVSDLHFSLRQLDWVVGSAGEFDGVVLAGDSLDISSTVPLEVQCEVIVSYAERLQASGPVVISSGNHDLTGEDANGERSDPVDATGWAGPAPPPTARRWRSGGAGDCLPLVGRAARQGRGRGATGRRRGTSSRVVGLDVPLASGRIADVLDGSA